MRRGLDFEHLPSACQRCLAALAAAARRAGVAGCRGAGGRPPLQRVLAARSAAGSFGRCPRCGGCDGRQGALLPRSGPGLFPRRFHWSSQRQVGAILKSTGGPGRAAEGEGVRGDWLRLRRQLLSEPGAAAARSGPAWDQRGEEAAAG